MVESVSRLASGEVDTRSGSNRTGVSDLLRSDAKSAKPNVGIGSGVRHEILLEDA
jgi:hypothetical protein